ncbi:hypothetical protein V8E54_009797 [Elaphomyces granulatus]
MSPSQIQLRHVEREWIVKRTGKRRIVDRDICCAYVDEKTGTKCDWKTTDLVTKEYDNPAAPGKEYSPLGRNIKAAFHRRSGSRF